MTADNAAWVARLEAVEMESLTSLRLRAEIEVAILETEIWLRGPAGDGALDLALRKLPGLRRFALLPGGELLPHGARVPEGRQPELRWQPLRDALPVSLPGAVKAASTRPHTALTLIRSDAGKPAAALLTDLAAWLAFATSAPEIRLRPLRFTAARDGRVWIEGSPLPALPGRRFHRHGGIAALCGWSWSPAVEPGILRRWLGLAEGDTAFADEGDRWEILKAEQFVSATRGAARLTAQEVAL